MNALAPTACQDFFAAAPMRRREVLRAGALSLAGLDLPLWFQAQAAARAEASSAGGARPRAKACIFLFMWGGPAQQDTWDMKPNAPAEYRGEFQPIATKIPGLQ